MSKLQGTKWSQILLAAVLALGGASAHAGTIGITNNLLKPDIGGSATLNFTSSGSNNGTFSITGLPGLLTRPGGSTQIATGGSFTLNGTVTGGVITAASLAITFDPSGAPPLATWFSSSQLLNSGFGNSPFSHTYEFLFSQQAPASGAPAFTAEAPAVGSLIGVTLHNQSSTAISFASSFTDSSLVFDAAPVPVPATLWGGGALLVGLGIAKRRRAL
jgi:hypothetical protein